MQKRFMSCLPDAATWTAWRQQLTQATTTPWLWQAVTDRSAELFPRFAKVYHKLRSLPRRLRRQMQRRWACSLAGIALALVLHPNASWAANFTASTATELIAAINSANDETTNPGLDTISLTADITLTAVDNTLPGGLDSSGLPVVSSSITIAGNGHTITRQSGTEDFRHFLVDASGELVVQEATLSGGVVGNGGSIFNDHGLVTLTDSTLSGNAANGGGGGGIFNLYGTVTLTDSTLSGNAANGGGGGIFNLGSVTLTNSTLSGNTTPNNSGGGLFNVGSVTLINSTLSGNTAGTGGGLFNVGSATLTNNLISGNSASFAAEIFNGSGTTSSMSLFGHRGLTNAQAFFNFTPSATDITATADGTTPTALNATLNTTLANNGGPTLTHNLVAGSPAIDAGDAAFCPETDQRGVLRPVGSGCDIGSVEFNTTVSFIFTGFFSPVDNNGVFNQVKAGQSIPVKFSLGGNFGLDVLDDGSPSSQQIGCTSGAPIDDIEETVTAGVSSLTYDATTNQYKYTWKTQKVWAGTCRQLKVSLADGSVHTALFIFK